MLQPPVDLLRCSWPRPVQHAVGHWTSAPDWAAPPLPLPLWPQPRWTTVDDALVWMIDWSDLFRSGVPGRAQGDWGGEMRGFHLVFHLRVTDAGPLAFWAEDGCLLRRNGRLVHASSTGGALPASPPICGGWTRVRAWDRPGSAHG